MSRYARKIDDNHAEIVETLRSVGASVESLAAVGRGCPDLLVCFRETLHLLEVKDGKKSPSRRRLTPAEATWHSTWRGPVAVVTSPDEALRAIGARFMRTTKEGER